MKTITELKTLYLGLDEGVKETLTHIFTEGRRFANDEEAWLAISDRHDTLDQVEAFLGNVRPGYKSPVLASDDDEKAKIALANPTATRHEIEEEVAAKAAPERRARTHEELADVLYGRGRY
jgi:hypothetical protein